MALNPPTHGLHPEDDDDCLNLEYDDEVIYKKAVKMHGPEEWLKQPVASLKDKCMEFYIYRAEEWLSIKDKTSVNIFDSMPNFLRAQFLDYIAEYAQRFSVRDPLNLWEINLPPHLLCPLICLLMLKDRRKMDLHVNLGSMLTSLGQNEKKTEITGGVVDILSQLSAESPNLKQLSFNLSFYSCSQYIFDRHQLLDQLLACKFQNLAMLNLGMIDYIGNKQLQDISLNFPLLVYLSLGLATSIKPNALVASISNLKRLRFFVYMIKDAGSLRHDKYHVLEDQIFNLCAVNLPHLEYLRTLHTPEIQSGCCHEMRTVIFSGSSQLRGLCTSGGLPEASLPNLNDLCFMGPILNIEEFDARVSLYKHLTSLHLNDVEERRVCRLLELIGHQLTNLILDSPIRFADFKIVALCPKLVMLYNFGCYRYSLKSCLDYADERNVSRMLCFMKDLKLDFKGTRAPQPLLKMLLASPKLEYLNIDNILMSAEDCRFFSQLKCCSLERFYFGDIIPAMDCSIRDLEIMVRGLFIHLPSVTSMLIALDYTSVDNGGLFSDWDANVKKYLNLLWTYDDS